MDEIKKKTKDSTSTYLLIILIVIGIISLVSLFFALHADSNVDSDKYKNQEDEVKKMLGMLNDMLLDETKLKDITHLSKLSTITEGQNLLEFGPIFSPAIDGSNDLIYYRMIDFIFHKGGGHKKNNLEFYIEAKSSMSRTATTNEEVSQDIVYRLYSDGTIEKVNSEENK